MIKINNPKPLKEIEELREKGLYNAPFSVLESVDLSKLKTQEFDDSEIQQRIDDVEFMQSEFMVDAYEQMNEIKTSQEQAVVEIYETLLGGM
ncbi:hypothetical protein ES702_00975 [subsurface metagenome]